MSTSDYTPDYKDPNWFRTVLPYGVQLSDLHRITEREDGPDLHDLVRLIEYLREHGVDHDLGQAPCWDGEESSLRVTLLENGVRFTEGWPKERLTFVGPDGTVYDAERNPL